MSLYFSKSSLFHQFFCNLSRCQLDEAIEERHNSAKTSKNDIFSLPLSSTCFLYIPWPWHAFVGPYPGIDKFLKITKNLSTFWNHHAKLENVCFSRSNNSSYYIILPHISIDFDDPMIFLTMLWLNPVKTITTAIWNICFKFKHNIQSHSNHKMIYDLFSCHYKRTSTSQHL